MDPLLDANEVARVLAVSRRTFEALLARGEGPNFLTVGRQRRWSRNDVESWMLESRLRQSRTRSKPLAEDRQEARPTTPKRLDSRAKSDRGRRP
ncbi:MAG: helix-turn-helix domain-containing protein [Xanthomonadales bacterium]|nr:helix-turn-helix domain-containing protein [Xanthomonadales bacterium]